MSKNAIPLLVVPYMGAVGRERCDQAGVQWLDLSGNARIVAPGVHLLVEGRSNQFKSRGPSSAFAPKASRIARWLLIHRDRFLTQREIALATDVDEGYTRRVVGRLEDENLVIRNNTGGIRPRDPSLLLDAWREEYDFEKHRILRVVVPNDEGVFHGASEQERAAEAATELRERYTSWRRSA